MEGILASDSECTNLHLQVLTEMPCIEYLYIGVGIMAIKFQGHKIRYLCEYSVII